MADEKRKLTDPELIKANGGGLFSAFNDEDYAAAGVEIVGPGLFYNDGYKFKGKTISTSDAEYLGYYYRYYGKAADSIEEAKEWVRRYNADNYSV